MHGFGRNRFHYRSRFWLFFAVHVEHGSTYNAVMQPCQKPCFVDSQKRELSGHAYGSKLAQGLELVATSKWYTHFHSDILVGNFGLDLSRRSVYFGNFPVGQTKIAGCHPFFFFFVPDPASPIPRPGSRVPTSPNTRPRPHFGDSQNSLTIFIPTKISGFFL